MNRRRGIVHLVGAGPGDPGLITVRGLKLLRRADVVVHDRLIPMELLFLAKPGAEILEAGKAPGRHTLAQDEINRVLVDRASKGLRVVRLKGGDPYVFGRGFEELTACRDAGIRCIVVPGVTSAIAAPTLAGVPLTHRQLVRTVAVFTARSGEDSGAPDLPYAALAHIDTVCIMMGRENLRETTSALIAAGRSADTPVACVERGTTKLQRTCVGTLSTIADVADEFDLKAPMVTVIGDVARFAKQSTLPERSVLSGKRIVVTRSESTTNELARRLAAEGAHPIGCPLIAIEYPAVSDLTREKLKQLADYDWTTFTSVHGVLGFFRLLHDVRLDARAFGRCRVAAVGPATAKTLRRFGVHADLIAPTYTAEALADSLLQARLSRGASVLFPRGDIARKTLAEALREQCVIVDELVVYETKTTRPHASTLESIADGVSVMTFYSPSAVQAWVKLLDASSTNGSSNSMTDELGSRLAEVSSKATIACIGPTTAAEARRLGLRVDVVANPHTSKGMVDALNDCFRQRAADNSPRGVAIS